MIKINKGVKMPPRGYGIGAPPKYPWLKMKIGDSFLVVGKLQKSMGTQATMTGKRHNRKFTTRKVDGGVRVWRVE